MEETPSVSEAAGVVAEWSRLEGARRLDSLHPGLPAALDVLAEHARDTDVETVAEATDAELFASMLRKIVRYESFGDVFVVKGAGGERHIATVKLARVLSAVAPDYESYEPRAGNQGNQGDQQPAPGVTGRGVVDELLDALGRLLSGGRQVITAKRESGDTDAAISTILRAAHDLVQLDDAHPIADVVARLVEAPGADELAARVRRVVHTLRSFNYSDNEFSRGLRTGHLGAADGLERAVGIDPDGRVAETGVAPAPSVVVARILDDVEVQSVPEGTRLVQLDADDRPWMANVIEAPCAHIHPGDGGRFLAWPPLEPRAPVEAGDFLTTREQLNHAAGTPGVVITGEESSGTALYVSHRGEFYAPGSSRPALLVCATGWTVERVPGGAR